MKIEHAVEFQKDRPSKELTRPQIPYFMQDVELKEIELCQKKYMEFKINMYPIELLIVCKNLIFITDNPELYNSILGIYGYMMQNGRRDGRRHIIRLWQSVPRRRMWYVWREQLRIP